MPTRRPRAPLPAETPSPERWLASILMIVLWGIISIDESASAPATEASAGTVGDAPTAAADLPRGRSAVFRDCDDCPSMTVIPAGQLDMGSPPSEADRKAHEGPVHRVRIDAPFALGMHEVTVAEFRAFAEATGHRTTAELAQGCFRWNGIEWGWDRQRNWRTPGFVQADDHPVVCISWDDARAYLRWLSTRTGNAYRLPSEAEWEYAARAGSRTARFWGESPDRACDYANAADLALQARFPDWDLRLHDCNDGWVRSAPVGSYRANAFGLRDMLGNVWEWTEDCYQDSYDDAPTDGSPRSGGDCPRVLRGGSWFFEPMDLRTAFRGWFDAANRLDNVGFRVARDLSPPALPRACRDAADDVAVDAGGCRPAGSDPPGPGIGGRAVPGCDRGCTSPRTTADVVSPASP